MLIDVSQLSALLSVVIIDVVLAGDNAILVGMAASGLAADQRRRVIVLGIMIATALRLCFALITAQLLAIIGLTLAGGVLLLWVSWKMYRDLRQSRRSELGGGSSSEHGAVNKTPRQALIRIVLADVSMSLDNVLAVAGAARDHKVVLWIGLALSIVLMAIASNAIAKVLDRYHWIAWIGFAIILYVAGDMIWDGTHEVVAATGKA